MCPFPPNNGGVVKFVFFHRHIGDNIPCTLNLFQSFNFHKADVLSLCVNQVRWIFSPHNSNFLYNQCLPGMQVVRYLPEFRHVDRLKIDFCLLFIFMAPFEPPVSRIFWYFRKISLASLDFSRDAPVFFWKRGNFSCSAIFMKCELDKFVNFLYRKAPASTRQVSTLWLASLNWWRCQKRVTTANGCALCVKPDIHTTCVPWPSPRTSSSPEVSKGQGRSIGDPGQGH